MRPVEPIVIVGAGHAGVQLAASLRQMGSDRAIALINDEPCLPYNRPPLSKEFLKSDADAKSICLRSEAFVRDNGIDLVAARVETVRYSQAADIVHIFGLRPSRIRSTKRSSLRVV